VAKSKSKYKALVIVESPAKARKISGYLGSDYKVLASMGHVRDLPNGAAEIPKAVKSEPWSRIGINVDSEFEPLYIIPKGKKKVVDELKASLKQSDELILATDEDREGESIGWHLVELLKPTVPTSRMVFGEITKKAILEALEQKRELDKNLVEAQETRRVLDRLFGYTLSPLLWKKVAPKLSAGRVQSVAVKVLVEREKERARFVSAEYWDLKAGLETGSGGNFDATLHTVDGKRVASGRDFDENTGKLKPGADVVLLNGEQATALRDRIEKTDWTVTSVESREQTRKPYPPFTTSTLQQESNRKLNMTARTTMQAAQRLYEEGHITYMRTDSVTLSSEAINAARSSVGERYGEKFLSPSPRTFTNKTKGAQEAHEAIRPAGTEMKTAEELGLVGREARLYALIWKRTMATQMADAKLLFQTVTISADEADFRATGRHVVFPGFFRAYVEGVDDPEAALDDQESALPPLTEAEKLQLEKLESLSHETKPPARFTEATLVRQLEAEGIGRPSTYASIIGTIQDRGYVVKQGHQLIPTFTAMAVTQLLETHFTQLVDYKFTAQMEQQLDEVASGEAERLPYLRKFYHGELGLDQQVKSKEEGIDLYLESRTC
jgi:DNA topoisomerase I